MYQKWKGPRITKTSMRKNKSEGCILPESEHHKAVVTMIVWYWHNQANGSVEQN